VMQASSEPNADESRLFRKMNVNQIVIPLAQASTGR
jgi:hypothetical protein